MITSMIVSKRGADACDTDDTGDIEATLIKGLGTKVVHIVEE